MSTLLRNAVRSVLINARLPAAAPESQALPSEVRLDNVRLDDGSPFADQWIDAHASELAASAVQQWAETDELGVGEGYADRLLTLLVGAVDEDIDGDLSDEESDDLLVLCNAAADYLASLGVADDDIDTLLNDWDNDAGERVQELVVGKLTDGDDAAGFVFGDGSDEAALDAVYKKTIAVRKGKKVRINKRVSGTVRLSAAQKVAVAKMRRKSNTGIAKLRRKKSVRIRQKLGL